MTPEGTAVTVAAAHSGALTRQLTRVSITVLVLLLVFEAVVTLMEALWWESTFVDPEAPPTTDSGGAFALAVIALALLALAVVVHVTRRRRDRVWGFRAAVGAAAIYFGLRLGYELGGDGAPRTGTLLWYALAATVALLALVPLQKRRDRRLASG